MIDVRDYAEVPDVRGRDLEEALPAGLHSGGDVIDVGDGVGGATAEWREADDAVPAPAPAPALGCSGVKRSEFQGIVRSGGRRRVESSPAVVIGCG